MNINMSEIVRATGGTFYGSSKILETRIEGVSTDSREQLQKKLFVPIAGERFDGHDFIAQAFNNGAACVLSQKDSDITVKPVIRVESTKAALCALAEYYRSLFHIPVVAITGSTGKTTTKDMTYSVLSEKYKTLCTEGNYNNEIGLPLTVFKLDDSYECAVLEMGMNHFGELRGLSKIARPDICVITNIGYTHIENLGSREGILKAKTEIFEYMRKDGLIILNGDDEMLKTLDYNTKVIRFGLDKTNDVSACNIRNMGFGGVSADIVYRDNIKFTVNLKTPGQHMVYNALCAAAVGFGLGLGEDCIKRGIESFSGARMRMNIIHTESGRTIINDVYNASPDSMKAAVDVLARADSPRACIIGDMLELGDYSRELHRKIGDYLVQSRIEKVICVGTHALHVYNAVSEARTDIKAYYFSNQEDMHENMDIILDDSGTVLVKASRAMALEKTVNRLL